MSMYKSKKRILIIDDEQSVLDTLDIVLSDEFDVVTFSDLDEAFDYILLNKKIDLVVIDYHIGKKTGVSFFKDCIRPYYPAVPAILVSGFYDHKQPSLDQAEIQSLFICSIEKPFDVLAVKKLVIMSI